jgi:hypothetical protein
VFKQEEYRALKGNVRPKFLHIGLKFWQMIAISATQNETNQANKE